ncbi:MAG: PAS domain S-box protein [Gemmataceae bacterium]
MTDTYWPELAATLFEEAGDALFLFDPETEDLHEVNPMAQRMTGYSRRELLCLKVTYLFRSETAGGLHHLRQAFRRTGLFHSQEGFLLRHKEDNTWVPVNLTVTRLHTEPRTLGLITARDISERRHAHAQLAKAEAELRRLMSSVSDCLWSAEVDERQEWTYCYFSPVVERITGRPVASFLGGRDKWLSLIHPEDRPHVEKAYNRLCSGESIDEEYRLHTANGSLRWVRDSVMVTRAANGRGLLLDGVLTDITDRKLADEALRESEARRRLLIEQMPAIIWTTDPQLRITYGAGAGLARLNIAPEQMVGANLADYFQSNDPHFLSIDAHHKALLGQSITFEVEWLERTWQAHVEPLHDGAGRVVGVIGVALDITDRKQVEQALRASETKYRVLVNNLTQCILLKDEHLRYVAANRSFCQSLGRTEEEIIGKTDFDFYPKHLAEKYRADDRQVLADGSRLEVEEETVVAGKLRAVRVVKTPIQNEQGSNVGVLAIFWDVTEQRQMEARLRQVQKLEAVGQLAGGIAHDFNNLLTGILGNLALALADIPDSMLCRDLLKNAEDAGLRATELIGQLLGFSRRTPLHPTALLLNDVVDETLRLLRHVLDRRIVLQVRPTADLWLARADAGQMNQVLMNLCLNARDAMPRGGCLALETANVVLDETAARAHLDGRPGEFVRLRVRDTGQGMPPEVQEHIFEPFFTTKEPGKGNGLGLAMVFGIIRQHEGWIECHSVVGQGTTFDIFLPRLLGPAPRRAPQPAPITVEGGRETILLADDEELVSKLGRAILERYGYQVLVAHDGAEAVSTFSQRPNDIDLVILDLSMPKLGGPDALRQLRAIKPTIPVIISTAYTTDEELDAVRQAGADAFVPKPYRPAELARCVRTVLEQEKGQEKGDATRIC